MMISQSDRVRRENELSHILFYFIYDEKEGVCDEITDIFTYMRVSIGYLLGKTRYKFGK